MTAAARRGAAVAPILRKWCPEVYRQIIRDSRHAGLFRLWGRSANFDDNAQETIVDPAIVRAVGEIAGVPMHGRNVHAGLLHTYGYLFSLIDTPYGAKRDRWILEHLENGFGLSPKLLSDTPAEGTLLANVTWFFGQFAFRDDATRLRRLRQAVSHAAGELVEYDFTAPPVRRIVEVVRTPTTGRAVRIFTDLVAFPHPPKSSAADHTLLVYSLQNGVRSPSKLITGFSLRQEAVDELLGAIPRHGSAEVRLRYNAYLSGLYARTLRGRRRLAGGG